MTLPENHDIEDHNDELSPPPRILFWGLIAIILLVVVGILAGIAIFREVLTPGQQQRIIESAPFMQMLLPPAPPPDAILPTVAVPDSTAAMDLLNLDFSSPSTIETPTEEKTEAPTEDAVLPNPPTIIVPTATEFVPPTPTEALPTPTPTTIPPTPTDVPTQSAQVATSVPSTIQQQPSLTWAVLHNNEGFRWNRQTWNNCGAANITMAMSYYGWTRDQTFAEGRVKPEREDKNVSPHELVRFVNDNSDLRALYRIGGDLGLLRVLINNEFPVIIERSHMFEGYEWLGHYQTFVGYDDTQRVFYVFDSFLGNGDGSGILETYNEVDTHWQAFNRVFIVVYQPAREAELFRLLGELADEVRAAEIAFETAQAEARANPQNAFAWFNMGSSLVALGRYQEASTAYDQAMNLGLPWRMLWYQFGPYRAYYEVGRYQDVLNYANNTLSTDGGQYVEETYYWQGRALAAFGRRNEAINSFQMAIARNRNFAAPRQALTELGA